jgi:hypothetical protein
VVTKAKLFEIKEHQPMTALFPTFGNLLQRAKRLLATDITPLFSRFLDAIEADEARYQEQLRASGHEDFSIFKSTLI